MEYLPCLKKKKEKGRRGEGEGEGEGEEEEEKRKERKIQVMYFGGMTRRMREKHVPWKLRVSFIHR